MNFEKKNSELRRNSVYYGTAVSEEGIALNSEVNLLYGIPLVTQILLKRLEGKRQRTDFIILYPHNYV